MHATRWHLLAALLLGLALGAGSACAQTWSAAALLGEPGTGTIALRTGSGQLIAEVERARLLRCDWVLQRIARAYGIPTPELVVTASSAPNAFATTRKGRPAVGITTGMLRLAGDREEYLAAIIGHELGHLQAGHAQARRDHAAAVSTLGALVGAVIDVGLGWRGYSTGGAGIELGGLGARLLSASFSRDQEREADRLGAEAMAKAGFDPAAAVGLWRLLAQAGAGGEGYWLNTHPSHAEREAELTARARELAPVYAQNIGANVAPASAESPAILAVATLAQEQAARQGRLALRHLLGGDGVIKDHARARALSEQAAQAGDPIGQAVFGTMLRDGIAGPADPARGVQLLQQAAEHHVPWAHYQLGVAYRHGLGIPADRQLAVRHLSAAAPTVIEAQDLLSRIKAESP